MNASYSNTKAIKTQLMDLLKIRYDWPVALNVSNTKTNAIKTL